MAFIGSVGVLTVLFIQSVFSPFRKANLSGEEMVPIATEWSLNSFKNGEFQQSVEARILRKFGFRTQTVRFFNQLVYSAFGETTYFIEEGKDGYLFEKIYAKSVCGEDFIGLEDLNLKVDSLEHLNDLLEKHGKKLIVLFAPNKYRFFQDKIDVNCEPEQTNYQVIRGRLEQSNIEVIDANTWFKTINSDYPLIPKVGTHWSFYGAGLIAQQLQERLVRCGVSEGLLLQESMDVVENPRQTDKDLFDLLNIMSYPPTENLAYPTLKLNSTKKPKALTIGDSYYLTFYHLGLHRELFAEGSKFFHYMKEEVGDDPTIGTRLTTETIYDELTTSDIVILESNEVALNKFGWGFMAKAIHILENDSSL